ncbi:MAG: helix-turn-helix transcriptional regulator [Bryobacteraceae bacterium]
MVRILGILGALLEGGQPTVHSLASRFGTRRETIYRDLRALEDAGYPICGDELGRLSHPRRLPEARRHTPQLRLSDDEITALLWVAQHSSKSPFREALHSAAAKLRAMARGEEAAGVEAVMMQGGWGEKDYGPHRETILRLMEAILLRRRCEVEYQSPASDRAKVYKYDPYRMLSVAGGLYCLGKVPPFENLTTLAVDRIRALSLTTTKFEVDPGFDADRYRRESFGVIWEKPMNVTVRFSAEQAPYVRERVWHPSQTIRELPDGRIDLSFRAGGVFEIARWVLSWGDGAEVKAPLRLRHQIALAVSKLLKAYDDRPIEIR